MSGGSVDVGDGDGQIVGDGDGNGSLGVGSGPTAPGTEPEGPALGVSVGLGLGAGHPFLAAVPPSSIAACRGAATRKMRKPARNTASERSERSKASAASPVVWTPSPPRERRLRWMPASPKDGDLFHLLHEVEFCKRRAHPIARDLGDQLANPFRGES